MVAHKSISDLYPKHNATEWTRCGVGKRLNHRQTLGVQLQAFACSAVANIDYMHMRLSITKSGDKLKVMHAAKSTDVCNYLETMEHSTTHNKHIPPAHATLWMLKFQLEIFSPWIYIDVISFVCGSASTRTAFEPLSNFSHLERKCEERDSSSTTLNVIVLRQWMHGKMVLISIFQAVSLQLGMLISNHVEFIWFCWWCASNILMAFCSSPQMKRTLWQWLIFPSTTR